jgi:peptidoglycan/LPS O-acetylase OafA/YrhL
MNSVTLKANPGEEAAAHYRPDVDGLRALAVLSVVFYHLGTPIRGVYVGVDIFCTISGFLIGSIILRQTADRTFTFGRFYERRIRRIFPALFVMLFVTVAFAYKYLLPIEFISYAKSLAAVSLSISNVFFWLQSGYFDAPASTTPLLHTWSLAVEEQFYVFLPVALVLLHRVAPRRISQSIYLLALFSFLISVYGAFTSPSATFYLPHTRAWELLLGTMLALKGFPKISGTAMREFAGISGFALIVPTLVLYRTWTPFPGLAALPPCLGTALIIAAGESGPNLVGRLLSLRPVVFIGLISYSLYLWHWPLFVFYSLGFRVFEGLDHRQSQALLFAMAIVLAVLSWRFVELPFRTKSWRTQRTVLFGGATAATLIVLIGSAIFVVTQGLPSRFSAQAREVAAYIDNDPADPRDQYRNGICFITSETAKFQDFSMSQCLPDKPQQKTLLLLGDSHAAAMWWGFNQLFANANIMQATAAGCKPVLIQRPRQHVACTQIMNYILKEYLPSHRVDAVLIEAHWDADDMESLGDTVAWLRENRIPTFLVGPIVQYDSSLPRLLALSISQNAPQLPERHLQRFVKPLNRQMETLARENWRVPYISLFDIFCPHDSCLQYAAPGVPLLSDYGHLTKAGSILAARRIAALGVLPLDPPLP